MIQVLLVGAGRDAEGALARLLALLPRNRGVLVLVAAQRDPHAEPDSLAHGPLADDPGAPTLAVDKRPLPRAGVLVAPPGYHLLVEGSRCALSAGPPENGQRPSLAALFESARDSRAVQVVAALLLGDTGADGAEAAGAILPVAPLLQRPHDVAPEDVARALRALLAEAA